MNQGNSSNQDREYCSTGHEKQEPVYSSTAWDKPKEEPQLPHQWFQTNLSSRCQIVSALSWQGEATDHKRIKYNPYYQIWFGIEMSN